MQFTSDITATKHVSRSSKNKTKLINFMWYEISNNNWKPNVRENSTLVKFGKYAYLYAGRTG